MSLGVKTLVGSCVMWGDVMDASKLIICKGWVMMGNKLKGVRWEVQ